MTDDFAHLHVHVDTGSILDGFGTTEESVRTVAENGQPGLGISDHGDMASIYDLHKYAAQYGIKPIAGIEAYVTPGTTDMEVHEPVFFSSGSRENREERSNDVSGGGAYTHMTMFAENNDGMRNLFKLSTMASQKGYYRKPRMSVEAIAAHSEGLIGTTGCPSGELQTRLRLGQWDEAIAYASKMQSIFGRDNYYLELMDHDMSIGLERDVREGLLKIGKELSIPHLITNDAHYATQSQAKGHEHLLCMQSGSSMNQATYENGGKRFAFDGNEYYLKTRDEMERLFDPTEYKQGLDNTLEIVERCNTSFSEDSSLRVKALDLEPGLSEADQLRKNSFEGLAKRIPHKASDPEYVARLERELEVFNTKGFDGYMLVVQDFMCYAKFNLNMVCGPARGSGGGSLVAFALYITDMDPIEHGLIFERFLNPERPSAPDIDSDFPEDRRDEIIEYVRKKYGEDYVSMINTFGKIKAKNALKDIARIFDKPYSVGETLTKAYPDDKQGVSVTLRQVMDRDDPRYNEGEDFRELLKDEENRRIYDAAAGIEGRTRSTGVHAAGVIMSSQPLVNSIPLKMRQSDQRMITAWDYPTCESLGLIKMDFLGLRNLTVIQRARDAIIANHGIDYDLQEIYNQALVDDDPKTYEMLSKGHTLGVFQLDSNAITSFIKMMRPTTFNDLSAAIALYRPGPMGMESHFKYAWRKNGAQEVEAIHPELKEPLDDILAETYHLIVYQEQVMAIAQKVAGYSLGSADNLRRIMGKKKAKDLEKEKPVFMEGMKNNGYSQGASDVLWETLIPFSAYGFNKSHSVGYALISLVTAKMKAHYPAEFMAANLSTLTSEKDKTALYLEECRHLGIDVLQPSVSESGVNYIATKKGKIRVGLSAIRGVGTGAAEMITQEASKGKFKSLEDFLSRVPAAVLTKTVIEGLALSGAMDEFGYSRRSIRTFVPGIAKGFAVAKKKEEKGIGSLFDELDSEELELTLDIEHLPEYTKKDKLTFERHALGLYVSDHPLSAIADSLDNFSDISIVKLLAGERPSVQDSGGRAKFNLAGIVNSVEKKVSKAGKKFAVFSIEDMGGSLPGLMFSRSFEVYGEELASDSVYKMRGSLLEDGDDDIKFAVDSIEEIEMTNDGRIPFNLYLTENQVTEQSMKDLGEVLKRYPGTTPVYITMNTGGGMIEKFQLHESFDISSTRDATQVIRREIMSLFGTQSV